MDAGALLELLRQDPAAGTEALLRQYGPLLHYVVGSVLRDRQDAEDCYSEVTELVWRRLEDYDPARGSLTAWLTAVARNTALNHARKNDRHSGAGEMRETTPAPEPGPEEEVLRRERQEAVRQALDRLPAGERILFYRKYYYCQSTAQIAAELGLTERAVEGRLYRIKKQLRGWLGGEGYEGA